MFQRGQTKKEKEMITMTTPYFNITPNKSLITVNKETAEVVYQLAQMLTTDELTDFFIDNYNSADDALADFISAYEGTADENDLPYILRITD